MKVQKLHGCNRFFFFFLDRVGTVGPKEFVTAKVEFTPKLPGQRKIVIDFASDKLHNVETYENLVIYE